MFDVKTCCLFSPFLFLDSPLKHLPSSNIYNHLALNKPDCKFSHPSVPILLPADLFTVALHKTL